MELSVAECVTDEPAARTLPLTFLTGQCVTVDPTILEKHAFAIVLVRFARGYSLGNLVKNQMMPTSAIERILIAQNSQPPAFFSGFVKATTLAYAAEQTV